jgi:serine protease Do
MNSSAKVRLIFVSFFLLVLHLTGCAPTPNRIQRTESDMRVRIQHAKAATVRILVNGQASGTGFIVSPTGTVVTCFHVVQTITPNPTPANPNQITVGLAANIQVELSDGQRVPATAHPSSVNQGFAAAIARDYFILNIGGQNRPFLKTALFATAHEGDRVYSCGFPMGIEQPVIATGIVSTKWQSPDYLGSASQREVAWLDLTMNKGNSGGPIILAGDHPEDDRVVGIATFILNPFAKPVGELVGVVNGFPGSAIIMGMDFETFAKLVGTALASASMGVSGCVSADYFSAVLQ